MRAASLWTLPPRDICSKHFALINFVWNVANYIRKWHRQNWHGRKPRKLVSNVTTQMLKEYVKLSKFTPILYMANPLNGTVKSCNID